MGNHKLIRGFLFAFAPAVCACVTPLATTVPDVNVVPNRLTLFPANVVLFELGIDFVTERPDWSKTAAGHVDSALAQLGVPSGMRILDKKALAKTEVRYWPFHVWSEDALRQINSQLEGRTDFKRHSVAEWRFRHSLASWRTALNSDFVMVVLFREGHSTPGRIAANIVAPIGFGRQMGIACIADLRDGRMVWCSQTTDPLGDLRDASGAETAVRALVGSLWQSQ
jgi:hypothetical protein